MPYRDRDKRLAASRAHHAQHRPSPVPLPQDDGALPLVGTIETSDDGTQIQCHVCGRWFGQLHIHIHVHGLDAAAYKAAYGLARGASLLAPATAERQRQAAIARKQASKGVAFGPDNPPQPRTGVANRLESRIRASQAQRAADAAPTSDAPPRDRAVGDPER